MSTVFSPTWTDSGSTIVAATNLAKGSVASGTLSLLTKRGAYVFMGIGRTGTTALNVGCWGIIRRLVNNHAVAAPGYIWKRLSTLTAAVQTAVNSDSNSGQAAVNVTSSASFAADDYISINAASAVTRLEFARVSKTAAGVLTCDANLVTSHTSAQADKVQNKADFWVFPVEGGTVIEVVFDYGGEGNGENLNVVAWYQSYDSDLGT